jgi:hypothetical protein
MRLAVTAAVAATLIAASALAQNYGATQSATPNVSTAATNNTANKNAPSNPAVKTSEGNNPGAPVPGANSFTAGQAKARIESRGYANVMGLEKDNNGFWRGNAMKDGKSVNVTLDYQGNVTVD